MIENEKNDVLNFSELEPNEKSLDEDKVENNNIESKKSKNETGKKENIITLTEEKKNKYNFSKFFYGFVFILKYLLTSVVIFAFLLLTTNYSAYTNIVKSYIYKDELIKTQKSLLSSVKASSIKEKIKEKKKKKKMFINENNIEIEKKQYKTNIYSINQLINKATREDIQIDINISPYENRIVIPKIGKNIPLIDIKRKLVSGKKELNNIFMEELKNGVVRYPGSVKPGQIGKTFIFGHSSNFPWISGDYNQVFALLDKVSYDDEIIIYYGQKKFTYKITEKKVIRPGNIGVLKGSKGKKEITLMTCWPIGTTLNRLIVTGELVE